MFLKHDDRMAATEELSKADSETSSSRLSYRTNSDHFSSAPLYLTSRTFSFPPHRFPAGWTGSTAEVCGMMMMMMMTSNSTSLTAAGVCFFVGFFFSSCLHVVTLEPHLASGFSSSNTPLSRAWVFSGMSAHIIHDETSRWCIAPVYPPKLPVRSCDFVFYDTWWAGVGQALRVTWWTGVGQLIWFTWWAGVGQALRCPLFLARFSLFHCIDYSFIIEKSFQASSWFQKPFSVYLHRNCSCNLKVNNIIIFSWWSFCLSLVSDSISLSTGTLTLIDWQG